MHGKLCRGGPSIAYPYLPSLPKVYTYFKDELTTALRDILRGLNWREGFRRMRYIVDVQ